MADEVEAALAFVARREGRRSMPAGRWAMVMSLDLGWMPPGAAEALVARGVAAALLRPEGGDLRLAVDPATVEVPRGFRPSPGAAGAAGAAPTPHAAASAGAPSAADPFLDWVDRVAAATRAERRQVLDQVAAVQREAGGFLSATAAVLWLAARAGLDVRQAAAAVRP